MQVYNNCNRKHFFGAFVEKYGTKKLIIAGMASLVISSLMYAYATTLFVFYLAGVFLGIGVAWTTTSMVGVVINRWFEENKGTVMGVVLASNGLGAALAIHIITPIIYSSTFGYQSAYRLTALILVVVTLLIILLYKEKRSNEQHLAKDGKREDGKIGIEYGELIKKPYFYAIILAIFLHMLVTVGSITTPHFTDIGLSSSFVANTLSLMVVALAFFKLFSGVMYDHMGIKVSTNICLVSVVVSKLLLLFITNSLSGRVLTIVYCLINALATPIETVMLPILALDVFGQKCYNKTLGIITSVATVGQTLGTPLLNLFYDYYKSYNRVFLFSALVSVLVVIIMNYAMKQGAKNND